MKCAKLMSPGKIQIVDVERPAPRDNEVLIEIDMAAICGSDAALYEGKYTVPLPLIPGHEAVGSVTAVGSAVDDLNPGQRVVIEPHYACNTCTLCRSGLDNICPRKVRIGLDVSGVFAQFISVPRQCVWPVPDTLPSEVAVFAEPVAVACHGFAKARPGIGQKVLILGAGVIGLLMVQLSVRAGAIVFTMDMVDQRLALSKTLGASAGTRNMDRLTRFGPFDVVFETSGAPVALAHAVELAAPGGCIVILGLAKTPHPLLATPIVRKELSIYGSMIYTDEFPEVIRMLANGEIRTEPLVSGIHPLASLADALGTFHDPDRVKTLIRISQRTVPSKISVEM